MVRRSFRLGLRLGLLAGVLVALVKVVQSRRSTHDEAWPPPGSPAEWPPLQPEPVPVEPAAPTVADRLPPVRRAPAPPPPPTPAAEPPPPVIAASAPAPAEGAELAAGQFEDAPSFAAQAVPAMAPAPPADESPDPWAAPIDGAATVPAPSRTEESRPPAAPAASGPVKKARRKAAAPRGEAPPVAPSVSAPAVPAPAKARVRKARRQPWVEPLGSDAPTSHPVKAKLSSMLYHLPGMVFYDRTRPDRCYVDADAAEADGFMRAKR